MVDTLASHRNKMDWAMAVYKGKLTKYNKFVKEQRVACTWTDEAGIIVHATADYLAVTYHIAGDDNCSKNSDNPVLVVEGEKDGRNKDDNAIFHVEYYQDKHFQSLEQIPGKAVPCCKIEEEVEVLPEEGNEDTVDSQEEDDTVKRLRNEQEYLMKHILNEKLVEESLKRLRAIEKKIVTDHLFQTEITEVLFGSVREKYGVTSLAGREARRILKTIVELGKNSAKYEDEDLPDVTFVEDDEPIQKKTKSFKGLFGKRSKTARTSEIVAEAACTPEDLSEDMSVMSDPVLCSTVLPTTRTNNLNFQTPNLFNSMVQPTFRPIIELGASSRLPSTLNMTHIADTNISKIRNLSTKKNG